MPIFLYLKIIGEKIMLRFSPSTRLLKYGDKITVSQFHLLYKLQRQILEFLFFSFWRLIFIIFTVASFLTWETQQSLGSVAHTTVSWGKSDLGFSKVDKKHTPRAESNPWELSLKRAFYQHTKQYASLRHYSVVLICIEVFLWRIVTMIDVLQLHSKPCSLLE